MLLTVIAILFACSLFRKCSSTQFSGDRCCQDSDCAGERVCWFLEIIEGVGFDAGPCAPGKPSCTCSFGESTFEPCIVDASCPEGDLCQDVPNVGRICQSRCLRKIFGESLTEEDKAVCNAQPEFPDPCPANARPSLTPRASREPRPSKTPVPGPQVIETPPDFGEVEGTPLEEDLMSSPGMEMLTPEPTEKPSRKPKGTKRREPDVTTTPDVEVASTQEADPAAVVEPTPSPTDAVCVAVEELEGVEKVFEQDYHAWVLCDNSGSCATPGHMVLWEGSGMMMRSYCDIVGCERKVMPVNSPKWSAGVVRAKTKGLAYTSFAARWESKVEERLLATVVRFAA